MSRNGVIHFLDVYIKLQEWSSLKEEQDTIAKYRERLTGVNK